MNTSSLTLVMAGLARPGKQGSHLHLLRANVNSFDIKKLVERPMILPQPIKQLFLSSTIFQEILYILQRNARASRGPFLNSTVVQLPTRLQCRYGYH